MFVEATAAATPAAAKPVTNGAAGPQKPPEGEKPAEKPAEAAKPEDKAAAEANAKFAALVRKERALKAERDAFKAEKEEAAKARAELVEHSQRLARAKRDPDAAAKVLWGDNWYDHLTQYRLNDNKTPADLEVSAVRDELEAFKKQTAEEKAATLKQAEEHAEAQRQEVVTAFRAEVADFITKNPDEYELINLENAHALVASVIETEHGKTGKLLTNKEAADKVEEWLVSRAKKLQAAKKFQAKAPPQPELNKGERKPVDNAQPRTLSNDMTVSSSQAPGGSVRTEQERIQRALAALSK